LAKDGIRRGDRAVIVEGYVDVIMAHQHGFPNVIAPLGTALNEKHIGVLKKLTRRIVLALDADSAGQMATLKGIEVAKQGFDSKTIATPTARGLIRFEQQLDADVRVATLPAGKDPDDVVREGGGRWRELIERAMPVVDYYFATVAASVDMNTAKGKSEAIERLVPIVLEVKDRIEREHYIQKLARLTHIEDSMIRAEIARAAKAVRPTPAPVAVVEPDAPAYDYSDADAPDEPRESLRPRIVTPLRPLDMEDKLLAFILRYREDTLSIEGTDGTPVKAEDFGRSENRLLFEAVGRVANGEQSVEQMEESLGQELVAHYERLQNTIQTEPELTDLVSIRQDMAFQLNRQREFNLRRIYEQGSLALHEVGDESDVATEAVDDSEPAANHLDYDRIFSSVVLASEQLKQYYPKKSSIFRDTRDR
jgi:DNA primase